MLRVLIFFLVFLFSSPVRVESSLYEEEENIYSQTVYGGVGLIVTPNARFSNDGEFGFGFSSEVPFNRLYANHRFFLGLKQFLDTPKKLIGPIIVLGNRPTRTKELILKLGS